MKKQPCKCEACKAARADARAHRITKARWQAAKQAAFERMAAGKRAHDAHVARVGTVVTEAIRPHLSTVWGSQDGREITVQGMGRAHLFFALAKGYRGEYPPGSRAHSNMKALEAEALRRLSKAHFPQAFMPPNPDGSYRDRSALEAALSWGR